MLATLDLLLQPLQWNKSCRHIVGSSTLKKTLWDIMRHYETWDAMTLYETSWNIVRHHEAQRHHETLWEIKRHYETSWDTVRQYETLWVTMRHSDTWVSYIHHSIYHSTVPFHIPVQWLETPLIQCTPVCPWPSSKCAKHVSLVSVFLSPYQWTPLHRAAENGHETVVLLLIQKRADINIRDQNQVREWDWVVLYYWLEFVVALSQLTGCFVDITNYGSCH